MGLAAFLVAGAYAGHSMGGEYWWVASLAAGYYIVGEISGDIVALDRPQQIRLQHESGSISPGYNVIVNH
jgi:hypothetical protein